MISDRQIITKYKQVKKKKRCNMALFTVAPYLIFDSKVIEYIRDRLAVYSITMHCITLFKDPKSHLISIKVCFFCSFCLLIVWKCVSPPIFHLMNNQRQLVVQPNEESVVNPSQPLFHSCQIK